MSLTGFTTLIGNTKPNIIDTTLDTLVFEGYQSGSVYVICKIDFSTPIISRTWSTGNWDDRSTLNYR